MHGRLWRRRWGPSWAEGRRANASGSCGCGCAAALALPRCARRMRAACTTHPLAPLPPACAHDCSKGSTTPNCEETTRCRRAVVCTAEKVVEVASSEMYHTQLGTLRYENSIIFRTDFRMSDRKSPHLKHAANAPPVILGTVTYKYSRFIGTNFRMSGRKNPAPQTCRECAADHACAHAP